jgi:hypothetical protein
MPAEMWVRAGVTYRLEATVDLDRGTRGGVGLLVMPRKCTAGPRVQQRNRSSFGWVGDVPDEHRRSRLRVHDGERERVVGADGRVGRWGARFVEP